MRESGITFTNLLRRAHDGGGSSIGIREAISSFLICLSLMLISFSLEGRIGLGLDDEAFLFYGTQRFIEGGIPLRDFQSYDPGRYIWCSLTSLVFGDGILGLRAGVAAFQAIGLFLGLSCLLRPYASVWRLLGAGLILLVWMYPRHKLFEPAIAMGAVFFCTLLLRNPSSLRLFLVGLFAGVALFFGRNHGAYCLVGFGSALLLLRLRGGLRVTSKHVLSLGLGLGIGLSPFILTAYLFPGFASAFAESLLWHLRSGNLNLALPVPWPWNTAHGGLSWGSYFFSLSHGLLLLLIPIFYLGIIVTVFAVKKIDLRRSAAVLAGALIGIPYLHHAFSRADLSHLAQAIHPFLISVLCLPALARGRISRAASCAIVAFVVLLSVSSVVTVHPVYERVREAPEKYVAVKVQGDELWVPKTTASLINGLYAMEMKYFAKGGELLAVPHLPGAYALLGRKSPLWQTYFFFPEGEDKQRQIIGQIEERQVRWLLLGEGTIDGREELRFRSTHPLVWRHLMDAFVPVPGETLPGGYQLYRKRA